MIGWSKPVIDRQQAVLFAPTLDSAVGDDHPVRLVAEVLESLDFSAWEGGYDGFVGQPPIHPRVLAGGILYGLSLGIRSSRRLEDACGNRVDFIWLMEGRVVDHSTFCKFRTKRQAQLKGLFRQVVLAAREMGLVKLNRVIWDGTRIKANNARSQTAREARLTELVKEVDGQFETMMKEAQAVDEQEDKLFGEEGQTRPLPKKLAGKARRREELKKALATVKQMQEEQNTHGSEKGPAVPLTDGDSRVLPNKEGGFAPNYTPVVAVDGESGVVVDEDIVPGRCEDEAILPSLDRIEQTVGQLPRQGLADSGFHTGRNLAGMEERGVEALIPEKVNFAENPAVRADPTQAVAEEQWPKLPVNPTSKVLDKAAFVYDEGKDCYWCPLGQMLPFVKEHAYQQGKHFREYRVYGGAACAGCGHRAQCIKGKAERRQIYREKYDVVRQRVAERLRSEEGQRAYRKRLPGEGVFGIVKAVMGVRQFLLRGMQKVKQEWTWVLTAYNLRLLVGAMAGLAHAGR
jgi:transposase